MNFRPISCVCTLLVFGLSASQGLAQDTQSAGEPVPADIFRAGTEAEAKAIEAAKEGETNKEYVVIPENVATAW